MDNKNKSPKTKEENLLVIMKGAPDRVIPRCTKILIRGKEFDLDEKWKRKL